MNSYNQEKPIIGAHSGLKTVLERVDLVASTDMPVLLLGETGSGKEIIARAIHERSYRKGNSFLRVNCGAITPSLIDSELFGHEKGSFTGASSHKQGWFERSDGGTLFLDEIGEMPLSVQVRLLRVLQDGTFERVGGEKPRTVNVRIIAATHRDLTAMVAQKEFREDLWYRISSFPVRIPSLKERIEDIPDLTRHYMKIFADRFGLPIPTLHESDLEIMKAYSWPGNVRELETVVARAVLIGKGQRLEMVKAIGLDQIQNSSEMSESRAQPSQKAIGSSAFSIVPQSLEEATKYHIERCLEKTAGRIDGPYGAAKILNLHPNTLRSKMKKLGLNTKAYKKAG